VGRTEGLSPEKAIYRACTLRFRPILMTTMAALLGGVPLMLGAGTGSELRQPLGYTIVGGLLLSQLLTLYTTPVVFLYLDRFGAWFSKGSTGGGAKSDATGRTPESSLAQRSPGNPPLSAEEHIGSGGSTTARPQQTSKSR
jgi:hypothetical protein